jgi:hypothetical protein
VPVQLVPVPEHPEAVGGGDPALGGLDHLALELDDLPAAGADQVIVVLVRDLEAGGAIEVVLVGEARLLVTWPFAWRNTSRIASRCFVCLRLCSSR